MSKTPYNKHRSDSIPARSFNTHTLEEILRYYNIRISELAILMRICRQTIYKWRNQESVPSRKILYRLEALYHAMLYFRHQGVLNPKKLLTTRINDAHTLMDLICNRENHYSALHYLAALEHRQSGMSVNPPTNKQSKVQQTTLQFDRD